MASAVGKLPPMLLWAVASRETNMRNVVGDGGRGVGIWQRDRVGNVLPGSVEWYLQHPRRQAEDAAAMLLGAHSTFGTWHAAIAAYNAGAGAVRKALAAGVDPDSRTTQGDYATDVESRRVRLLAMTGHPAAPTATTTRSAMPVRPGGRPRSSSTAFHSARTSSRCLVARSPRSLAC